MWFLNKVVERTGNKVDRGRLGRRENEMVKVERGKNRGSEEKND